ncbi:MAG: AIR synthase-related protein [Eubacteriales bacterium]|nr:AIR synthase-related protein [Eubacteriales bacterium]
MLRMGKLKTTVYDRSVKKQVHNEKTSVPFFVRTVMVEGWTLAAERVVYNMINTFAVKKADLLQLNVSVKMPEGTDEPEFRKFTKRLGQLCAEEKIWLTLDEAGVSHAVSKTVISAVGMGTSMDDVFQGSAADMDVIVAGTVAREGAAILALEHEEALKKRFAAFYVEIAQQLYDAAAMKAVRAILEKEEAWGTAVGEGGIFAGLWDMAAATKVGLDIDLSAIPIRQHTIEICEFFNRNPYMLLSGGCLLIMARRGERVLAALAQEGIPAAVIGHTTEGNDRIIRYDDEIRYLEPPKTDEIYSL